MIEGPAVIREALSTTFMSAPARWPTVGVYGEIVHHAGLRADDRDDPRYDQPARSIRDLSDDEFEERYRCDRFTATVLANRMRYIVEHMCTGLLNNAFSPDPARLVRLRGDDLRTAAS